MSRTLLLALNLLGVSLVPLFTARAATRELGPVILCYHIVESPRDSVHSITRETFVRQMAYLAESGYRVISLSQLNTYLEGAAGALPKNAVVVTVDDGWRSTLTEVAPVMKRFGFPFTAFIYPRFIGNGGASLSWDDVRTLMRSGGDIQSHTYSHAFLTRKRQRARSSAQYAEWLSHELAGSRRIIEREIGRPVKFLAYPYGDYDARVAKAVEAAGYAAALTCNEGPITATANHYRLRRFAIDRTTTFAQFKSYVGQSGSGWGRKEEGQSLLAGTTAAPKAKTAVRRVPRAQQHPRLAVQSADASRSVTRGSASDLPSRGQLSPSIAVILPSRREPELDVEEEDDSK
jgi:peptidoglycan/xylan/chitin deacetylase (PgdA/CDA1 family)